MRKIAISVLSISLILVFAVSCALWKEKATITYEGTGQILSGVYDAVKPACDSGQLSVETCVNLKDAYNKARAAYIVAGDTLILSMEFEESIAKTQDAVAKKELQAKLSILMKDYTKNLNEAVNLVREFEILYNELGR